MFKINDNYLKLPGSYLFSTIAKKVQAFQAANPDKEIIRLGIGDVTLPLAPVVIDTLHGAVDEMSKAETFHGYAPDLGYDFLRNAIVDFDYKRRGADISADEIFVSDGAKSDSGNIGDIFSVDNKIAVCDPVYPVYVDTNAMAGRTGDYLPDQQKWSNVIYMPCTAETNFAPELPKETPDIIYLCFPNNPTGSTITKDELQKWVDYANKVGAIILYDAAYEAYISEKDIPHSIYECEGARTCAIELRSFSKNAGFTDGTPWINVNPNYKEINAAQQLKDPNSIFHYYQKLISLRKEKDIIVYGEFEPLYRDDEQIFVYTRKLDQEKLLTVCNFSERNAEMEIPEEFKGAECLITNLDRTVFEGKIVLKPYEAFVLYKK